VNDFNFVLAKLIVKIFENHQTTICKKINMPSLLKILFARRSFASLMKELIILIVGYPLYLFSFCIPKLKNKWICGNSIGFVGNTKYFYLFLQKEENIHCYWISSDKKVINRLLDMSLPAYYTYSIKGLYHSLTAKVYIFSDRSREINFWTSGNSVKVNLWHGVGVKNLRTSKFTLDTGSIISKILFPYRYEKFSLLLSSSKLNTDMQVYSLRTAREAVYEGIYPRDAFLLSPKKDIQRHIQVYESLEVKQIISKLGTYSRVFIYMPTWRHDLKGDFLRKAHFDLKRLNSVLEKNNQLFILKLHSAVQTDLSEISDYSNLLFLNNKLDVYPILPFTDVLITDYSSIYYDYVLMEDKGILLYPFDQEEYQNEDFDLFDFEKYTPGKRIFSFDDLIIAISDLNNRFDIPYREWVLDTFWGDYKNHNQYQIYLKIRSIIYTNGSK